MLTCLYIPPPSILKLTVHRAIPQYKLEQPQGCYTLCSLPTASNGDTILPCHATYACELELFTLKGFPMQEGSSHGWITAREVHHGGSGRKPNSANVLLLSSIAFTPKDSHEGPERYYNRQQRSNPKTILLQRSHNLGFR